MHLQSYTDIYVNTQLLLFLMQLYFVLGDMFRLIIQPSSGQLTIERQLDATEVFIADLIACSTCFGHHYTHHQELKSIIQWLLRVVFCAVVFQVAGLV